MARRSSWYVLLAFGLTLSMLACATQKHRKAASLVTYVNEHILALAPIEAQALGRYAEVTGENYESDDQVYQVLENDVIPTYTRFYRSLRDVPIEDPEIGRLHSLYVHSARLLLDGFKMKRLALEKGDPVLMASANAKIENGRDRGTDWRKALVDLCEQYGVEEKKPD